MAAVALASWPVHSHERVLSGTCPCPPSLTSEATGPGVFPRLADQDQTAGQGPTGPSRRWASLSCLFCEGDPVPGRREIVSKDAVGPPSVTETGFGARGQAPGAFLQVWGHGGVAGFTLLGALVIERRHRRPRQLPLTELHPRSVPPWKDQKEPPLKRLPTPGDSQRAPGRGPTGVLCFLTLWPNLWMVKCCVRLDWEKRTGFAPSQPFPKRGGRQGGFRWCINMA